MPRARGLWGSLGFFMLYWSSFNALCLLIKINIPGRPTEESSPCPSSGLVNGKKDLGAGSDQKATRSPERHQVMAHFLRNFHSLFVYGENPSPGFCKLPNPYPLCIRVHASTAPAFIPFLMHFEPLELSTDFFWWARVCIWRNVC